MNLWTIHKDNGFSLWKGRVDHSKSDYYNNTPGVKEAYHQLWQLIGVPDGQIIWCYTRKEDICKTGISKTLWSLEVPEDSIIKYIDDIIWDCILGIRVRLTPGYTRGIEAVAGQKFPNDPQNRRILEDELENEFWQQARSTEELWNRLFLDEMVDGSPALLRHPIPEDWIIDKQIFKA